MKKPSKPKARKAGKRERIGRVEKKPKNISNDVLERALRNGKEWDPSTRTMIYSAMTPHGYPFYGIKFVEKKPIVEFVLWEPGKLEIVREPLKGFFERK